jgi:hypothetical protein
MFPTPDTRGFTNMGSIKLLAEAAGGEEEFMRMAYRANEKRKKEAFYGRRFPTPGTTGLSNGSGNCKSLNRICQEGIISDDECRAMRSGNGGQLNADWVERLMGYPDGWTDMDAETADASGAYPAAWIDGSWDSIPRIISGQKHRQARLKCLGNAVVPQVPMIIWEKIKEML